VGLWERTRHRHTRAHGAPGPASRSLSLRDEKILLTLVVQTQQLNDRLTRLEDRVEASVRESLSQPDQRDLLELRLHSARLAAELSRVTVELRAEIHELAKGTAAGFDDTRGEVDDTGAEPFAAPAEPDEQFIDLRETSREASGVPASTRRSSGWRPARPKPPPPGDS
jgi:hypothetical protein